jgi:hypothetical protein
LGVGEKDIGDKEEAGAEGEIGTGRDWVEDAGEEVMILGL